MPEPKQSTIDTLAEMLAEYKLKITRLEVALSHRENRFDAMELKNKELEDRLADCAQQKNDDTVPDAKNKLEAYWQGRAYSDCKIKELTMNQQNNDALMNQLSHKDRIIKNQSKANDWQAKRIGELEKELNDARLLIQLFQEDFRKINGQKEHSATEFQNLRNEHFAFSTRLRELSAQNENLEKSLAAERAHIGLKDVLIGELRKEKEHYEKVAQEKTTRVQYLESREGYRVGKEHGYTEALTKAQDAIFKLRK